MRQSTKIRGLKDILAVAVATFNDCQCIKSHEWKTTNNSYAYRLMFRGFETDVAVAVAMYDYLTSTIDRLCANYIEELGHNRYPAKLGDAYKKAASSTLCSRLREMQEQRREEIQTSTGTSMVIFKVAQVEAEFGGVKYTNTKLVSRADMETFAAQRRGRLDGQSIGLDVQIKQPEMVGALM